MPAPVRTPETPRLVEAADCDALGLLHPARYLDYFLEARAAQVAAHYDRNLGALARAQQAEWAFTKQQLGYHRPARQGAQVRISSQLIHFDNSTLVVEMQMRTADGQRLLALLWAEMAFVRRPAGPRLDHADALMDLLDELDVDDVAFEPDGFDDRLRALRRQLKQLRRVGGAA